MNIRHVPADFFRYFFNELNLVERFLLELSRTECTTVYDVLNCPPDSFSPSILTELRRIYGIWVKSHSVNLT